MKTKRILSLLIVALLMCGMIPSAAAEGNPRFIVSDVSAMPGEEVTLTVSLADNPGLASFEYTVVYDSAVLEWTGVTKGSLPGNWDVAVGEAVTWINADNCTDNGVVTTLSFKVKEGAAAQKSTVTIEYDPDNVFDENGDNVSFAVVPGSVTVTGSEPAPASACISGLGAEFSDAMTLKFYVKDVPSTVSPVFEVVMNDDNRTLAQAADSAAFALSNNPVYTAAWDEANGRWEIRVKVFGKWLSSAYTLRMYDGSTAGDPLPMKGYAYGDIGDSSVAAEHAYTMLDYCDVMRTWKAGNAAYAELYNAVSVYGGTMAQYWR